MGCCCSTSDQDIYEEGETGDKTNLLGNPVGEGTRSGSISQNVTRQSLVPDKDDEQEKLNKILQKTANSYIDVPALNSPAEQPNCFAKEKNYNEKVQGLKRHFHVPPLTLEDIRQPESELSRSPLSSGDIKMVNECSSQVVSAIDDMKIVYSENIVIPFKEPMK